MTLQTIVEDIYEGLGEPSDLSPYESDGTTIDTSSAGWLKLRRVVNDGCLALATWKWPSGRQVRMRMTEEDVILSPTTTNTYTLSNAVNNILTLSTSPNPTLHPGSLVVGVTSGAKGIVAVVDGTQVVLTRKSGTFVGTEQVKVYEREFSVVASGTVIEVVEVTDLETGEVLEEKAKPERYMSVDPEVGIPAGMWRVPRGFVLDMWPEEGRVYGVRVMRGPVQLVSAGEEPELPVQFHPGLVLYGIWWGLRRGQESTDAYATKRDLEDFMARTRTEFDFQDDVAQGQIKIYPQGR